MTFGEFVMVYLFLGGTAAGSFAVLSATELYRAFFPMNGQRLSRALSGCDGCRARSATQRRITQAGYSVTFAMLVVGMLCLLADLGRPEAFYLLFLYPTASFVSIGTFAITLFATCVTLALAESVLALGPVWQKVALVAKALGAVLSVIVMVYTGMLLMAAGSVPLWSTPLLPALFTVSAFDTGVALVELVALALSKKDALAPKARVLMERIVVVLVLVEIAVLAAFFAVMLGGDVQTAVGATAAASAALLLTGDLAACFWALVAACGLAMPLAMAVAGLVLHKRGKKKPGMKQHGGTLMAACAVGALIGGCALRFLILAAGMHADLVAETVMSLIG